MAILHNRKNQEELKQAILNDTTPRTTISFYNYFEIPDPQAFRDELYKHLNALGVLGRIYVANEGINAQISVPDNNVEAFKNYLYRIPALNGLRLNIAVEQKVTEGHHNAGGNSFWVLKIKVRPKIVADGITDVTFSMANKGKYVDAKTFNKLTESADTVVIDMRNYYEYEVGHFENSIEIPSNTFREQLPMAAEMMQDKKDTNIIMYCTGGIRCEKASAYMLHKGFKNVYHLEGGIINYANQVKKLGLPNKFIGKNFVFDDRLGERISNDVIAQCHQCGKLADTHTNCNNNGCHLLFIQCDDCSQTYDGCCSNDCKDVYHLPEAEQKKLRQGKQNGIKIFNKARQRHPILEKRERVEN